MKNWNLILLFSSNNKYVYDTYGAAWILKLNKIIQIRKKQLHFESLLDSEINKKYLFKLSTRSFAQRRNVRKKFEIDLNKLLQI